MAMSAGTTPSRSLRVNYENWAMDLDFYYYDLRWKGHFSTPMIGPNSHLAAVTSFMSLPFTARYQNRKLRTGCLLFIPKGDVVDVEVDASPTGYDPLMVFHDNGTVLHDIRPVETALLMEHVWKSLVDNKAFSD